MVSNYEWASHKHFLFVLKVQLSLPPATNFQLLLTSKPLLLALKLINSKYPKYEECSFQNMRAVRIISTFLNGGRELVKGLWVVLSEFQQAALNSSIIRLQFIKYDLVLALLYNPHLSLTTLVVSSVCVGVACKLRSNSLFNFLMLVAVYDQ